MSEMLIFLHKIIDTIMQHRLKLIKFQLNEIKPKMTNRDKKTTIIVVLESMTTRICVRKVSA